jgi:AAA family ATP:ADP antiporter
MKERVLSLLNLKVAESKYVFDLLSIQLFIGIANSLINIVSFTLFIHHFSIASISYAYIVIAVVLLLLNLGYEKLEKKMTPLHLLRFIIVCSASILLVLWTGLLSWNESTMIFLLLVWGMLFYMITGYAYWGLVSLLFNVRESKRVFSIVGSGDIPAKLIGYIAAPLLIPVIGLDNLLVLAVASLIIGFFLLNRVIHKKRWEKIQQRTHTTHHHHREGQLGNESLLRFFFKHKLIFTISLLSLLSYNVFNLVDYTFVTQIKAKIQNLSTLATYIAIFFGAGRLIALVLKLIFTSRVIERLGIISCLLITPVTLALFSVFFALFDQGNYTLYIFGIMAMLTEVLRSAMQEPVFFILFQPLNEHHRLRGHIIAKGYMLAPSLFIVGISLIVMRELHIELTISFTIKLLLLNLCVWAAVIFYIRKAYSKALHTSIARGVFSGEVINIYDADTIAILLQKIEKGNPAEQIYALKLLEDSSYPDINKMLENELRFGNAAVKKYALSRMEERGVVNIPLLEELIFSETDANVKDEIVTVLCKIDPGFLKSISNDLSTLDYGMRKNVIILLLNQKEFNYLHKAGNEINELLKSENPKERELAIDIISDLKNIKFTDAIEALINDADSSVKRNAMIAACKLKNKGLLPFVFERMRIPADKYMAIQGLFQYGDELFDDLSIFSPEELNLYRADLVKIASKAKGPLSTAFLLSSLDNPHVQNDRIIHVLWMKSFQAESVEYIYKFQSLLNDYLKAGIDKIAYHNSVPSFKDHELVKRSIGSEIWNDLTTALKICAILYPRKEINRIVELVESRDRHKLYNGMEMLEMVLPKKTSRQINELFDHLLDPVSSKKKLTAADVKNFLVHVVVKKPSAFNQWTKAICVYSSLKNNFAEFIREMDGEPEKNESILLTETRSYVLKTLQETSYVDH